MTSPRPSLLATLLRAAADWAGARHGAPKRGRAERRRRSRQRLKDRAALSDLFRDRSGDFAGQVVALQDLVVNLNAERDRLRQQIALHHELMEDLGRRNACLLDLCAASQHEAEHWKRFVEGEREREADLAEKLQLN
ncbi:hypothetical protein GGQ86_002877 [Xanthobacter flavus]|uniref:Uncharacterized protein n=2 Tax=Xanthobacter flavus TaxID=281 RepID=A0A9W6FMC5_XANFL|nr:hypothetical protein [Xanthobacter flavus]MDR6334395.1 hypothetical protein [Xanthobacter flavus]GLI25754.1 hypothetical protein XFLAVUS301_54280 [Xanthobacter flavus]